MQYPEVWCLGTMQHAPGFEKRVTGNEKRKQRHKKKVLQVEQAREEQLHAFPVPFVGELAFIQLGNFLFPY